LLLLVLNSIKNERNTVLNNSWPCTDGRNTVYDDHVATVVLFIKIIAKNVTV
jgi:hypothetical protein